MSEYEYCESCDDSTEPTFVCGDCDREFLMIDVRFYRDLREGTFKLKRPIDRLEPRPNKIRATAVNAPKPGLSIEDEHA